VIALVILARLTGILQQAEWFALDYLLRSRPPEPIDERILIVGIDEEDIRQLKTYPIPDRNLADLIERLQLHQPTVIGLDIFRDLAVEPGRLELENIFRSHRNLVGVEKILPYELGVSAPSALPINQVGFVDSVLDSDGFLRRSLLGLVTPAHEFKFSFTIRLVEPYLAAQGISLENGIRDSSAMRFGQTELTRFSPNSGSYIDADAGGNQILLHFRSGERPFHIVSLRDVMAGTVPDDWIRDRIVLVGITASSFKDVVNAAAVSGENPGLVNGVEIQAHAVSQILSAVLDDRPLLKVWSDGWEYLWIAAWGILGISLGQVILSPFKLILALTVTCILLISTCYGLLLLGWWLPLVPAFLTLFLNGAGLTASLFYRHELNLRAKLRDRQLIIDQTFDAIHNGPLQTLARMLSQAQEQKTPNHSLYMELKCLNEELRSVYESVRHEALVKDSSFHLGNGEEIDLNTPIHEVLYEVYAYTLERNLPCFRSLKLNITAFELLDDRFLTTEQKRGLCRFLEEALCNVGKHAVGVTRLEVVCKVEQGQNIVRVIDNGAGINATHRGNAADREKGRGTEQARELARQLKGEFRRSANFPEGTICEITWFVVKPWFWSL